MGFPVDYPEEEDRFQDNIERLIGSDIHAVEKQLGDPTSRIRFYDSITFIYARVTTTTAVGAGVFDAPVLLCYDLKFDENEILVDFERNWISYSGYHKPKKLCQMWIDSRDYYQYDPWEKRKSILYEPDKIPVTQDYYECDFAVEKAKREKPVYWKSVTFLFSASEAELKAAAKSGNPGARLQLYWNDTEDGLYWLCRAANQGYPKARYRIAQLYEFGDDGFEKNLLLAHAWYDLAAKACHPWARKDTLRISSELLDEEQIKKSNMIIEKIIPLDCSSWH
jgi:TPR repeat protein